MNVCRRSMWSAAAAAALAVAGRTGAQPAPTLPRVAYVWLSNDGPSGPRLDAFRSRMAELGWIHGRNIVLEQYDAHGSPAELDAVMQKLVAGKVEIIVAMCTPEALSARKFTTTIPIVMAASGDPVAAGLVKSLARPGGNITGVANLVPELTAKRMALLKEMVPMLTQATTIWNPQRPDNGPEVKTLQQAGARLAIKVRSSQVRSRDELAIQLDAVGWDGTQAILATGDTIISAERQAIVDRAASLRLPTVFDERIYVDAGGLMSYGSDLDKSHRHAADYVDRILKGAKPADLPVEQPTRFELVVNKKTAKALGLTIPRAILLLADVVIE